MLLTLAAPRGQLPSGYDLDVVVELIARRIDASGRWRVSASELREELGIDALDYYQSMYEAATAERSVLGIGDITGVFSSEGPQVLLAALEVFCGAAAEARLAKAGIFFPHSSRIDIIETLIEATASATARHTFDPDELSAMLRSLKGFEAARSAYIATHFPRERLIDAAVESYCGGRRFDIPSLARANVRRLIEFFFRRHVLSEAALFAGLSERMYSQAVDEGYVKPDGSAGGLTREPDALESARQMLGVAGLPISRGLLRDRYRSLMKRFHPDVNPDGLERAKEINAAYSRLLAALS